MAALASARWGARACSETCTVPVTLAGRALCFKKDASNVRHRSWSDYGVCLPGMCQPEHQDILRIQAQAAVRVSPNLRMVGARAKPPKRFPNARPPAWKSFAARRACV
eukprot:1655931-Alexandrium_andersonii.AAC.1